MSNAIIRSAKGALKESQALPSIWSKESQLSQRILIYIAKLLENQGRRRRKQKNLSKWQSYVQKSLREGKSIKQAAAEWKARRV